MRVFALIFSLVILLGALPAMSQAAAPPGQAKPLPWATDAQRDALAALFGGYAESFLCRKRVDFAVAADFLKSKFGTDSFTPEQTAEMAHMATGIQIAQMTTMAQKKLSKKEVESHCDKVMKDFFGPTGKVVPGLLK
jgi:hypothetical protein